MEESAPLSWGSQRARRVRGVMALVAVALVAVACSGSNDHQGPFASEDTVCESVELRNADDDQARVNASITCLMAEMDAGRAVTVDFAFPAPGGVFVYTRYAFDGETVWMIQDDRLDAFSAGTVQSEKCTQLVPTDWLPVGVDCDVVASLGFPEVREGL